MTVIYVYSPTGGLITGRDNYCIPCPSPCTGDGDSHSSCYWEDGYGSPVDLSASSSQWIILYVNYPAVKSIKTFVRDQCCNNDESDYGQIVEVELYEDFNAQSYRGSVVYGHIANPQVGNGNTYNLGSGSVTLGQAPATDQDHAWCYSGPHSHMERKG